MALLSPLDWSPQSRTVARESLDARENLLAEGPCQVTLGPHLASVGRADHALCAPLTVDTIHYRRIPLSPGSCLSMLESATGHLPHVPPLSFPVTSSRVRTLLHGGTRSYARTISPVVERYG